MANNVTFIGGPLDLQRITFDSNVPPFWRAADAPEYGAVFRKPEPHDNLKTYKVANYEILPIRNKYRTQYIGVLMEVD